MRTEATRPVICALTWQLPTVYAPKMFDWWEQILPFSVLTLLVIVIVSMRHQVKLVSFPVPAHLGKRCHILQLCVISADASLNVLVLYCYVWIRLLCLSYLTIRLLWHSTFMLCSLILTNNYGYATWPLPYSICTQGMLHGRLLHSISTQGMPHGRLPHSISSQGMPHGRLPLSTTKPRDGHPIMPLGCLPLSSLPG